MDRKKKPTVKEMISALPDYRLPYSFDKNVLAALGAEPEPAFLRYCKTSGGEALIAATVLWLATVAFLAAAFLSGHALDILRLLTEPGALLTGLRLYALKAWFLAQHIPAFSGMMMEALRAVFSGRNILPDLAAATVLTGLAVSVISKTAYNAKIGEI